MQDLEGFSHIHLLYPFHRAGPPRLLVTPFLDDRPRGVFATRAPCRPNAIGMSLVRLLGCEGNVLHIEDQHVFSLVVGQGLGDGHGGLAAGEPGGEADLAGQDVEEAEAWPDLQNQSTQVTRLTGTEQP